MSRSSQQKQLKTDRILRLLDDCLTRHFGVDDKKFHTFIENNSEYLDLTTGDMLLRQGERCDDVYFLLSGRLRALVNEVGGSPRAVGEIGRGETVGELALFTGRARGADVVAIRDSVVTKLSRKVLQKAIGKQPDIAMKITKQVIERYERMNALASPPSVAVSLTVLPITQNVDAKALADALKARRTTKSDDIVVLDSAYIDSKLGGLSSPDVSRPRGPVSLALGDMETRHDGLFYIADPKNMAWSETAIHHSDEVLLLADANAAPNLTEIEKTLIPQDQNLRARVTLVLMHPAEAQSPQGTARWLGPRSVARHVHIRRGNDADLARLSRIISGRAIGLVLSGGGARGFAHLGTYIALQEKGITVDMIGGTSAGAIMGSWIAVDTPGDKIIEVTRDVFLNSPVGNISADYNAVPLISLIKGKRAKATTHKLMLDSCGTVIDIEDTWKSFFTIASNYSTQSEAVLTRGSFVKNMMASFSIPGLMPPTIIDKHLMFDGGIFNNFPVDQMRRMGAGKIIGVDLMSDHIREYDLHEAPGTLALLRDKLRPKAKRKYRLPSIANTMLSSLVVTSMSRQKAYRDSVDILFQPNVRGVTMLDWKKYDRVVADTRAQALEQLETLSETQLRSFRN